MKILQPLTGNGEFASLSNTFLISNGVDSVGIIPAWERAQDQLKSERERLGILSDSDYPDRYPFNTNRVTHRRLVSEQFKINGVEVTIRGTEPSVTSVLNTLKVYPPTGPVYASNNTPNKYISLNEPCDPDSVTGEGAPEIGSKTYGDPNKKNIIVIMPDRTEFSGSGTTIFLKTKDGKIYIPVFSYIGFSRKGIPKYESAGGMISNTHKLTSNILYKNAIKETKEESATLFEIKPSKNYVDIKSDISDTKYRSYIHYITSDKSLDKIKDNYNSRVIEITKDTNPVYMDDYKETNDIKFISLDVIKSNKERLKSGNELNFPFYGNNSGNPITISSRTIKVLNEILNKNKNILNLA
jgi:hypothetical protein